MDGIKALTFDTGGTILDWHGGVSGVLAEIGTARGVTHDWADLTNEYRRRSLARMLNAGGDGPLDHNIDDVHREEIARLLGERKIAGFTDDDIERVRLAWHNLTAWPDFPAVLPKLREKYICASFTILSVALIVDTARANGLSWDAVLSCEMMAVYKLRPEAYRTAARWLQLKPEECLMVACHNFDLNAAREVGLRTAFVRRPDEWGTEGPPDPDPAEHHDIIVDDFPALAAAAGVAV